MSARDDEHCCFICERPFKAGEMVLQDITDGLAHRACFGDDREAFVGDVDTGAPLAEGEPLPSGLPYDPADFVDPAPIEREVSSERVSEERLGQIATDKDNFYRPEIKAMAQELLALRSSVKTVGVKKLEWRVPTDHPADPSIEDHVFCADGIGGKYSISKKQKVGPERLLWMADDMFVWKGFNSIPEAKAAAQADFERRILSAIEAPSEGEGVDEVHWIDELRKKAFRTNAPEDRTAYFEACSKWFQDRHYRRISPSPAAPSEVTEDWIRDTAMNVMLATEVEEAVRVLTAALKGDRP